MFSVEDDNAEQGEGSPSPMQLLRIATDFALQALKFSDCRSLFRSFADPQGRDLDPSTVLQSLFDNSSGTAVARAYGTIRFSSSLETSLPATTDGNGLKLRARPYYSTVTITLNETVWDWGYNSENTKTLLHELGHAMNKLSAGFGSRQFAGDAFSDRASQANTKAVQDNCIKHLNFEPGRRR